MPTSTGVYYDEIYFSAKVLTSSKSDRMCSFKYKEYSERDCICVCTQTIQSSINAWFVPLRYLSDRHCYSISDVWHVESNRYAMCMAEGQSERSCYYIKGARYIIKPVYINFPLTYHTEILMSYTERRWSERIFRCMSELIHSDRRCYVSRFVLTNVSTSKAILPVTLSRDVTCSYEIKEKRSFSDRYVKFAFTAHSDMRCDFYITQKVVVQNAVASIGILAEDSRAAYFKSTGRFNDRTMMYLPYGANDIRQIYVHWSQIYINERQCKFEVVEKASINTIKMINGIYEFVDMTCHFASIVYNSERHAFARIKLKSVLEKPYSSPLNTQVISSNDSTHGIRFITRGIVDVAHVDDSISMSKSVNAEVDQNVLDILVNKGDSINVSLITQDGSIINQKDQLLLKCIYSARCEVKVVEKGTDIAWNGDNRSVYTPSKLNVSYNEVPLYITEVSNMSSIFTILYQISMMGAESYVRMHDERYYLTENSYDRFSSDIMGMVFIDGVYLQTMSYEVIDEPYLKFSYCRMAISDGNTIIDESTSIAIKKRNSTLHGDITVVADSPTGLKYNSALLIGESSYISLNNPTKDLSKSVLSDERLMYNKFDSIHINDKYVYVQATTGSGTGVGGIDVSLYPTIHTNAASYNMPKFTVSFWVKINEPYPNVNSYILFKDTSWSITMYDFISNTRNTMFRFYNSSGARLLSSDSKYGWRGGVSSEAGNLFNSLYGNWAHVAVTISDSTTDYPMYCMYVNGELMDVNNSVNCLDFKNIINTTDDITFSIGDPTNEAVQILLTDINFYARDLSGSDVYTIYKKGVGINSKALVSEYTGL